jgi:hypothetical protein
MTPSYRKFLERSRTSLGRILRKPAWDFNRVVADPRQAKGRRWQCRTLRRAVLCGFLTNRERLRAVESIRACGFDHRIPDSTLDDFLGKFSGDEVADLRRQLHAQVHPDWRSKALEPVGLPCGVVAVDHTTRWTGPVAHAHDPHAQVVHQKERPAYAQVRAVHTVLRSAVSKPAIEQVASRVQTHEEGRFPEVWHVLEATYGALMEIYRLDAGFGSPAKAQLMAAAHQGSIRGLHGHQPEWWREAERVLGAQPHRQRAAPGNPIKAISSAIISIARQRWKPIWTGAICNRCGEWRKSFARGRPARWQARLVTRSRTCTGDGSGRSGSWPWSERIGPSRTMATGRSMSSGMKTARCGVDTVSASRC